MTLRDPKKEKNASKNRLFRARTNHRRTGLAIQCGIFLRLYATMTNDETKDCASSAPQRGSEPAPKGTRDIVAINALRNGAKIARLAIGNLPRPLRRVAGEMRRYRRDLEDILLAVKGEVSPIDAHHISAAVAHEQHAAICRWLLCHRFGTMATADIVKCSASIAHAKAARNASVRVLGIDPRAIPEEPQFLYERKILDAQPVNDNHDPTPAAPQDTARAACRDGEPGGELF